MSVSDRNHLHPRGMASLHLFSSGSNARGQLGTGSEEDACTFQPAIFAGGQAAGALPAGITELSQIVCGANHTLALLTRTNADGTAQKELWGCGDGRRAQLGPAYLAELNESNASAAVFRPIHLPLRNGSQDMSSYAPRLIAAGWETSYVVLSCAGRSDVLLAFGADDYGNLGNGEKGRVTVSPYHYVDLQQFFTPHSILAVASLSTGPHHVVVCLTAADEARARLVGWGAARHGQLGTVSPVHKPPSFISSPRPITLPAEAQLVGNWTTCELGTQHTVLQHRNGDLFALGSNRKGQTEGLAGLRNVIRVGCTWNATYATLPYGRMSHEWKMVGTGTFARGLRVGAEGRTTTVPFPDGVQDSRLMKLACGSEHVLCLTDPRGLNETQVWGWGWNEHGNLGIGTTEDVEVPVKIFWLDFSLGEGRIVNVWAGCGTSWILVKK